MADIDQHKQDSRSPILPMKEKCGLVMPISAIDGCNESHWTDVREILENAIDATGFTANLVSNADDVGIIQKRIIQNLYDNPIVVCDVSGKNPNVMFELGVRLAFDKPTVIVKDDRTSYSFDTSPIEHLQYPRDLRYSQIAEFKEKLSGKVLATYAASKEADYTTFLKHFGEFKIAKLGHKDVSAPEAIIEELRDIQRTLSRLNPQSFTDGGTLSERDRATNSLRRELRFKLTSHSVSQTEKILKSMELIPSLRGVMVQGGNSLTGPELVVTFARDVDAEEMKRVVNKILKIVEQP